MQKRGAAIGTKFTPLLAELEEEILREIELEP